MNVVDLFVTLVKIPSPLYKVRAMQTFLIKYFKQLFPDCSIVSDAAGNESPEFEMGNLLIKIPASPGLGVIAPLAVEAHVDTVREDHPINPIIDLVNDRITSDGTTILGADDKAAVAAICIAMELVRKLMHGPIEIIFSVGEEASMYGIKFFDLSQLASKQILCIDGFEPTHILTACAGKIKYRASFQGRSAHGAEPEKAINAVDLAGIAIAKCISHGLSGRTKYGVIHNMAEIQSHEGPSQYPSNNTIPGTCTLAGELRGLDKDDLNRAFEKIRNFMEEAAQEQGGSVSFEILVPYEPFSVSPESSIVRSLKFKNPKKKFVCESCDGSTHSNIYNSKDIESVVIGAGAHNPHSKEEYCIISELEEAVEIIARYLVR